MHVKFISTEETYPLRHKILRPELTSGVCYFPKDNEPGTFHLATVYDGQIISVGTFTKSNLPFFSTPSQCHLKGMATSEAHRGLNAGSMLLKFAIDYLKGNNVELLWCNARITAVGFYKKLGFTEIGDTFEVEGIGLHKTMYIELKD
ncbi:GNAT family N-acetyltransferase [Solitalea koreensis]|uniref:N-acetyltransferase domain-containing protein n=1 Tax=Solitalea koreensis TaxID=543615 RepID=A0A521EKD4_9SPHI|nr:GNAT family N-acetyltransferase [Solitalea koreensis]SMO84374.1 hypothetical protein SAMN06265350_11629 [Solitalea koreensis]